MAGSSARLKKLRDELAMLGDEAMLVEEFDGFVGGLIVCPEMIVPSEWLPLVWASEDDAPVFGDLDHVNRVLASLMEHYNDVARTLADKPERYAPLFPVERRTGEVLWEVWVEGFEKAIALRPGAWRSLLTADEPTARAFSGIRTLADVARRDARFTEIEIDALSASGHEHIAGWVVALNGWRVKNRPLHTPTPKPSPAPAIRVPKVGRNEPCPCGSNRKYKRCHGAN